MEDTLKKVYEYLVQYGFNLLASLMILVIGYFVSGMLAKFVEKLLSRAKMEPMITSFVKHLTYYALLVFVIVAALNKLGVQTTSIIAILGAASLAIGLALQGSLSNFASGVMIILFKPFKTGDYVQAGGTTGTIKEVQVFNTILHTPDNKKIIVPNSKITADSITNFSDLPNRRVDLMFGISYDDDIKTAKDVLKNMVESDPRVLSDPPPMIAVMELANSSVNIVCRPWVKVEDYWGVYFDFMEKGKIELEAAGLSIPYPQRDVHIFNEKPSS